MLWRFKPIHKPLFPSNRRIGLHIEVYLISYYCSQARRILRKVRFQKISSSNLRLSFLKNIKQVSDKPFEIKLWNTKRDSSHIQLWRRISKIINTLFDEENPFLQKMWVKRGMTGDKIEMYLKLVEFQLLLSPTIQCCGSIRLNKDIFSSRAIVLLFSIAGPNYVINVSEWHKLASWYECTNYEVLNLSNIRK